MSAPFASDLVRVLDERHRADMAEVEARVARAEMGEIVISEDGRSGALIVGNTPELQEAVKRWPVPAFDPGEGIRA